MRLLTSVLFALVLATTACASSPSAPSDPVIVTLAPGTSGSSGSLKVTFIRVTGDSRCPGDATCITAGDAQAAIEVDGFGAKQSAELHLVDAATRSVTVGSHTITFQALTPYPFLSLGPIAPGAYRATFKITR